MRALFLAIVILILGVPFANALIAPDPPSTRQMRVDHFCSFMMTYELLQAAIGDAQKSFIANGQKLPKSVLDLKLMIEDAHTLACTFGSWDNVERQKRCLRREYVCSQGLFRSTSLSNAIDQKYEACKEVYQEQLLGSVYENADSWAFWWKERQCSNLQDEAHRQLWGLAVYLKSECRSQRNDPSHDAEAIKNNMARGKLLEPTFDSISSSGITLVGHYLCALDPFVLNRYPDISFCYQQIIDDYVRSEEELLAVAQSFKEMCEHFESINPS